MNRQNVYSISFTRTSKKQFNFLPGKIKKEIAKILEEELAYNPLLGKPLQGPLKGLRSQRVGVLRIIYKIVQDELVIIVISLEHRKSVYRSHKLKKK
ncbi:MAG: type II toxin-antitoxin system mRNA interferase toxin, RelE/StbE family [Candidatus Omnitrophica bacterium]|nr:type II toxin-antitoxin system mRNA interferase toxin, RelE/StbE family [Candidatus Omnitrophota bacterium]